MTYAFTITETQTFTVTHAKHIASKVATDLKRMQRFYGQPSDARIANYEAEIIELLKCGGLETVSYGFHRKGQWIEPTLRYTAQDLAGLTADDDDPGRVRPGANIDGASFYSFLTYSSAWDTMSPDERLTIKNRLPIQRGTADEPGISGYLHQDRIYSGGGRALQRASIRSF